MAVPKVKGLTKTALYVWDDSANTYKVWQGIDASQLVPAEYDSVYVQYIAGGSIDTVDYYAGGTGGTKVSTLSLTYSSGLIATVTRS